MIVFWSVLGLYVLLLTPCIVKRIAGGPEPSAAAVVTTPSPVPTAAAVPAPTATPKVLTEVPILSSEALALQNRWAARNPSDFAIFDLYDAGVASEDVHEACLIKMAMTMYTVAYMINLGWDHHLADSAGSLADSLSERIAGEWDAECVEVNDIAPPQVEATVGPTVPAADLAAMPWPDVVEMYEQGQGLDPTPLYKDALSSLNRGDITGEDILDAVYATSSFATHCALTFAWGHSDVGSEEDAEFARMALLLVERWPYRDGYDCINDLEWSGMTN